MSVASLPSALPHMKVALVGVSVSPVQAGGESRLLDSVRNKQYENHDKNM